MRSPTQTSAPENFNTFGNRRLREKKNLRARARDAKRLIHQTLRVGSDDDSVGATVLRSSFHGWFEFRLERVESRSAEAVRKLTPKGKGIAGQNIRAFSASPAW